MPELIPAAPGTPCWKCWPGVTVIHERPEDCPSRGNRPRPILLTGCTINVGTGRETEPHQARKDAARK